MQQYQVTGMSCAACQARVEKAVAQVPGVTSVAVSLLTNSMGVEGTADSRAVIAAVEKAGYGASLKAGYDASLNTPEKERSSASSQEDALKDRETPRLLRRLALSAGFLLVLMYLTMGHHMLGLPLPPYFDQNYLGLALTQMLLALIVMFINRKFFESGTRSLLHGAPNMDTLVALGSGVSFAWSLFVFFTMCGNITNGTPNSELHELYHNQLYFESAAMIPTLITVGKALESRSKGRTTDALRSLMKLAPKTARVLRPASCAEGESCPVEVTVPIEEVRVEDIFAVKPGESIPVDGIVVEGESAVDESALTGESIPVDKTAGDKVSAATINHSGYLLCRATRVGEDTTLSQIIRMVSDAAATKAPIARIADKVSGIFVPAVIGIAILVTAAWLVVGKEVGFALARGICVLVISCPCALGLATPVAIMVGNGLGARNGVLFKTSEAIEETGKATIVALDKTGTITTGQPCVMGIYETRGTDKNDLLRKAYLLEKKSEHPLARAIVEEYEHAAGQMRSEDLSGNNTEVTGSDEAKMTGSENSEVTAFTIHAGHGLEGRIGGKLLHAGSGKYIRQFTDVTSEMQETETACAEEGQTPLFFEEDGKLLGIISVADSIRDDSEIGIRNLKNLGLTVVMLTGDNPRTADAIAQKAGVDYVVSGILPDGKADAVKKLQKNGKVIMVGDGINDAPAMATADIGIAIGAGTDVAIDSADVVLMNSALTDVAAAVRLSRKTLKNIHENLFWAFFYNVICIPVAAGVLSWKMNPMIGAAAMSLSSFTVCMNALRLNLFKMRDTSHDVVLNGRKPAALPLPKPGATSEATVKTPQAASERIVVPETEKGSAKMKKVLIIEGMMCGHCEASVKKALEALPYIASAAPDHTSNTCVVDITDDGAWDEEAVKAIIEGKDYKYLGTKD
ncbi:MAG: heavy metal translocating P-type ATPase [Clostridiales bacterium]|nr:heavy metal translocating P-type ATPase [Clostridiales bacterium]